MKHFIFFINEDFGGRELPRRLKDVVGVPIATTHVGAFARPRWYNYSFNGRHPRLMTMDTAWREAYTDALKIAIKEQEMLGVDILNDYCLRYDQYIPAFGWPGYVLDRLDGVQMDPSRTRAFKHRAAPILQDYNESIPGYVIVDKLGRGRLAFASFFSMTQQMTSKPVKFSVIDPVMVSAFIYDEYFKDRGERMFEFARVYNEEYRDLVNAGCKIIQTDDFPPLMWAGVQPNPIYGPLDKDTVRMQIEAFNASVKGINAQFWLHECWGRPRNQMLFGRTGNWAEGIKLISEVKADVIQIEEGSSQGKYLEEELAARKDYCPDKDVVLGVINHRSTLVETEEEVANMIRRALKYVPPENLGLSTDCGLAALPRDIAYFKLKALVDGARLVRKELGIEA